jgi:hypothetical protein
MRKVWKMGLRESFSRQWAAPCGSGPPGTTERQAHSWLGVIVFAGGARGDSGAREQFGPLQG